MGEQQHTVELVQGIASVALEERSGIVTRHIACVAPLQPDLKRLTLQGHGRPFPNGTHKLAPVAKGQRQQSKGER